MADCKLKLKPGPWVPLEFPDNTTPRGFEPLRAEPSGFRVHLLSHSDSECLCTANSAVDIYMSKMGPGAKPAPNKLAWKQTTSGLPSTVLCPPSEDGALPSRPGRRRVPWLRSLQISFARGKPCVLCFGNPQSAKDSARKCRQGSNARDFFGADFAILRR